MRTFPVIGGARACPVQVTTRHELADDSVAGVPVTVSSCPHRISAIADVREVGGRVLAFGTSGLLRNSSLAMYDRQTEGLWSHLDAHPNGLVPSRDTGFSRADGRPPNLGPDTRFVGR